MEGPNSRPGSFYEPHGLGGEPRDGDSYSQDSPRWDHQAIEEPPPMRMTESAAYMSQLLPSERTAAERLATQYCGASASHREISRSQRSLGTQGSASSSERPMGRTQHSQRQLVDSSQRRGSPTLRETPNRTQKQRRQYQYNIQQPHSYSASTSSTSRQLRSLPSHHMALQRESSLRQLRHGASSLSIGSCDKSSAGSSSSRDGKMPASSATSYVAASTKLIEVFPGHKVPLRGATETWSCIENDFFTLAHCVGCSSDVCCISDADFVICPACRVVSALESGMGSSAGGVGGAGLGFTFEDLAQWQTEILRRRERRA